jgi:predicted HAD superfamily Cof-like phosphohydrolase
MSINWSADIFRMHEHYGVHEIVDSFDSEKLKALLRFRLDFLKEELNELETAINEGNAEEIVDALIDINVVSTGTLDMLDVDANWAWDNVLEANMNKQVGIKESRPNPLGLPDLIKPEGWTPPSHVGNHGNLTRL